MLRSIVNAVTFKASFEEPPRNVCNAILPAGESSLHLNRRTTCRPQSTAAAVTARPIGNRPSLPITGWRQAPVRSATTTLPCKANPGNTFRRRYPATIATRPWAGPACPSNTLESRQAPVRPVITESRPEENRRTIWSRLYRAIVVIRWGPHGSLPVVAGMIIRGSRPVVRLAMAAQPPGS